MNKVAHDAASPLPIHVFPGQLTSGTNCDIGNEVIGLDANINCHSLKETSDNSVICEGEAEVMIQSQAVKKEEFSSQIPSVEFLSAEDTSEPEESETKSPD